MIPCSKRGFRCRHTQSRSTPVSSNCHRHRTSAFPSVDGCHSLSIQPQNVDIIESSSSEGDEEEARVAAAIQAVLEELDAEVAQEAASEQRADERRRQCAVATIVATLIVMAAVFLAATVGPYGIMWLGITTILLGLMLRGASRGGMSTAPYV